VGERGRRAAYALDDTEAVLGRTLAETAALNSREHRAGRRAAATVRASSARQRRWGLLKGWVWFAGVVVAVGLVALGLEIAGR
jgi:hypothetical protein